MIRFAGTSEVKRMEFSEATRSTQRRRRW
jgi:hypothetical protein